MLPDPPWRAALFAGGRKRPRSCKVAIPGTFAPACRRFSTAPVNRNEHGCNDDPSGRLHNDDCWDSPSRASLPLHELDQSIRHVVEHLRGQPWIDSDPEGLVHDEVGHRESADTAMRRPRVRGLSRKVPAEE